MVFKGKREKEELANRTTEYRLTYGKTSWRDDEDYLQDDGFSSNHVKSIMCKFRSVFGIHILSLTSLNFSLMWEVSRPSYKQVKTWKPRERKEGMSTHSTNTLFK